LSINLILLGVRTGVLDCAGKTDFPAHMEA